MERTHDKVAAVGLGWVRWRLAVPHLRADKLGGTTMGQDIMQPRVPVQEKIARKPLAVKTCGGGRGGRNTQPLRRIRWRDPQGPRMDTNPLTWESAPEGPNLLVGSGGSD